MAVPTPAPSGAKAVAAKKAAVAAQTAHKTSGADPYKMYKSPGVNGFSMKGPKG